MFIGDNPYVEVEVEKLGAGGIIGIILAGLLFVAILVDLCLCALCGRGVTHYCCVKDCGRNEKQQEQEMEPVKNR